MKYNFAHDYFSFNKVQNVLQLNKYNALFVS